MKVAVIGGGIGGLSAALQLLKAGFDVHVYEQAPRIAEIGAGIQISPNASRLLLRLCLKAAMDAVGMRPRAVHQRRWEMDAPCSAHRSGPRSRRSSARRTTTSIAPIWSTFWPTRCRKNVCMWTTSS
jgi:2-polyprenyl-6-methoxyphenol hydroxylase-like FAD-dependent oxidoreductase